MKNIVTIRVRPAGFFSRSAAFLIDLIILSLTATFIVFMIQEIVNFFGLTNFLARITNQSVTLTVVTRIAVSFLYYFYSLIYFSLFWTLIGSTPGKYLLGLRILRTNGKKISFFRGLVRAFCYYISALLLFMGFIWIIFDKRRQGLHDKIAGTIVIYT
jgi:uncharacterized RDD family membrane protein YckC